MKISKRQLIRIIKEEADQLSVSTPSEVEPIEDVWSGDLEGKDRNLVLPIDYSKSVKSDEVTRAPESLDDAVPVLSNESRLQVYRSQNDLGRLCKVPKIIYERYYDAYVSGNSEAASNIIEEHLDHHFPGWSDYEWRN
jgi:hypothetical protein